MSAEARRVVGICDRGTYTRERASERAARRKRNNGRRVDRAECYKVLLVADGCMSATGRVASSRAVRRGRIAPYRAIGNSVRSVRPSARSRVSCSFEKSVGELSRFPRSRVRGGAENAPGRLSAILGWRRATLRTPFTGKPRLIRLSAHIYSLF